ncbi:MAG: glycosyltransferase family 39 protein, partial [Candidatus Sulfobium sp.]
LWLGLGKSVFALRLLSALLCTGALWFAFKWIQLAYGPIEAIVGILLLAFSPAMIVAASEVRQYALLLFFICGALYCLQRFLMGDSLWSGFLYSAFLYGAILTHYSAIWVVLAFGIYASILILRKKHGGKVKALWVISQVGVIGFYILLYITHIRWLIDSGFAQQQIQGYLKRGYFSPGRGTITAFITGNSLDFFTYIAGGRLAGIVALICFLLGVASLLLKRRSDPPRANERHHSSLLVLPFIVGCAGAIVGIYPFEGSRHLSYLLPFAVAGIALCFVRLFSLKRLSLALAAGIILVPIWLLSVQPPPNIRRGMSDAHMQAALAQLNKKVPAGTLLVVDDMTHYVLAYYLGGDHFKSPGFEGRMGKYRVAWSKAFAFSPDNFERELAAVSASQDIKAGEFVWAMSVGWFGAEKFKAFLAAYPRKRLRELWNFGPITIFQISLLSRAWVG